MNNRKLFNGMKAIIIQNNLLNEFVAYRKFTCIKDIKCEYSYTKEKKFIFYKTISVLNVCIYANETEYVADILTRGDIKYLIDKYLKDLVNLYEIKLILS